MTRNTQKVKIYTKTGDKGLTRLVDGSCVEKFNPRVKAYGSLDELNSQIGFLRTQLCERSPLFTMNSLLEKIQNELFDIGSLLACENPEILKKLPVIDEKHSDFLEQQIDYFSEELAPLKNFILPGGHPLSAQIHIARTLCRKSERKVAEISIKNNLYEHCLIYLNRLSDLFFTLARWVHLKTETSEHKWRKTNEVVDLLILQHEESTPPGSTLEWAESQNLKVHIHWSNSSFFPPLETFKALIICGGSMNPFEEDRFSWLKEEKKFLRLAIENNKPIFGLCLGAQLLAEALGGSVYPMGQNQWEIGWAPIQINSENMTEPLHVFEWHACTFDLPSDEDIYPLATGTFCKNQAFRKGHHIIATQFHPESTEKWIEKALPSLETPRSGSVQNPKEILEGSKKGFPVKMKAWYFQTLTLWFENTKLPHSADNSMGTFPTQSPT